MHRSTFLPTLVLAAAAVLFLPGADPLLASGPAGGETAAAGEPCHSAPVGGEASVEARHEAHHEARDEAAASSPVPGALGTVLLDEQGHRVRLGDDVLDGRVVVMNFIFTTCTTICPPMGAHFGKLQRLLAEEGWSDVRLVSISIDPERDTPQRLAAWRERFGGSEGWTLLTGEKPQVDAVLKALKVFTPLFEDHAPLALLSTGEGPDGAREWRRVHGLTPPAELLKLVAPLRAEAAPAADGAGGGER